MKKMQAIIAAAIITALVGMAMAAVGVNAMLNPNSLPVQDAPASASSAPAGSDATADQVRQLQNLVAQYQAREKQYQTQLNQANAQLQQYQALLTQLQQSGLIHINSDGSVQLGGARRFGEVGR